MDLSVVFNNFNDPALIAIGTLLPAAFMGLMGSFYVWATNKLAEKNYRVIATGFGVSFVVAMVASAILGAYEVLEHGVTFSAELATATGLFLSALAADRALPRAVHMLSRA